MKSADALAASFSIPGLLDDTSQTRSRFPVQEIPVADIAGHPGNSVYSMDEEGIEALAASILKDGLTDLPLVRRLADGSYQMLSGHRRKAAYALLAEDHPDYARIPCRVVEGIDDGQAVALLHSANYFTRALSVTERAEATRALGVEVDRIRRSDESVRGMRTEDVKAAIIEARTGRKVSGKTIRRQEALADLIQTRLAEPWRKAADAGDVGASAVESLAVLPLAAQKEAFESLPASATCKRDVERHIRCFVREAAASAEEAEAARERHRLMRERAHPNADRRLTAALALLRNYLEKPPVGGMQDDLRASALIADLSTYLPGQGDRAQQGAEPGLRRH